MRMPQKNTILHGIRVDKHQWWGNMASTSVKTDGGGYTHLQSSDSEISSKVGILASTSLMVMVDEDWGHPRPITPNWHAIMSMVIVPHTFWIILLTTMVTPPAGVGPVPPLVEVGMSGFSPWCWQSPWTQVEAFMVELQYSPVGLHFRACHGYSHESRW